LDGVEVFREELPFVIGAPSGCENTQDRSATLVCVPAGAHVLDVFLCDEGQNCKLEVYQCPPTYKIEKELLDGPDEIGIYLPGPTRYVFEITYCGPAAKIIDTVPAEFKVVSAVPNDEDADGIATPDSANQKGNNKSATIITWDVPDGCSTLTVVIQTRESPGKGHTETVFKPTSCGPLPINDGATAYEVDEDGDLVLVEVVDPDTGEVTLEPVVIVGPSNALVVKAVEGAKPCVEEEEEEDD
jgi:hypothetical protein